MLLIFNNLGALVYNQSLTQNATTVETMLKSGVYFYKLIRKNGTVQTGKLISQQ